MTNQFGLQKLLVRRAPLHRPGESKTISLSPSDPRTEVFFPLLAPGAAVALEHPAKFRHDLFYTAPFYHRILPQFDRIIVVDTDVVFRWVWRADLRLLGVQGEHQGGGGAVPGDGLRPAGRHGPRPVLLLPAPHSQLTQDSPGGTNHLPVLYIASQSTETVPGQNRFTLNNEHLPNFSSSFVPKINRYWFMLCHVRPISF